MKFPLLAERQVRKLRKLVLRYKHRVRLGKPWNQRTADELSLQVLVQIVVAGRAEPGSILKSSPAYKKEVSLAKLNTFRSDRALQKHINQVMREIRTRFARKAWTKCRKSIAAVHNFRKLTEEKDGPRGFFEKVAALTSESQRINFLIREFQYYGRKAARDTLIDLRLAKNCIALDTRILALLRKLGAKIERPITPYYEQLEQELIQRVARPCGISGAKLDRILFQNYHPIFDEL